LCWLTVEQQFIPALAIASTVSRYFKKIVMKKIILSIIISLSLFGCQNNKKTELKYEKPKLEILLIGTFHFRNFDPKLIRDVVQTNEVDILSLENQNELELIKNKI
jgi:hypothetical protein